MINSKYVGLSATVVSFLSAFPQLKQVNETKNVSSLSMSSKILSLIASVLWLIFSIMQKDHISAMSSVMNIIFISYFIYEIFIQKANKPSFLTD